METVSAEILATEYPPQSSTDGVAFIRRISGTTSNGIEPPSQLPPLPDNRTRMGTTAAVIPGKNPTNESVDEKPNELDGGKASGKDMLGSMGKNTVLIAAQEKLAEVQRLKEIHIKVAELLRTEHGVSSNIQKMLVNPLRIEPHRSKVSKVLEKPLLLMLNGNGVSTVQLTAESIMTPNSIPLGIVTIPTLMQGAATGTGHTKKFLETWAKNQKLALTLASGEDDDEILSADEEEKRETLQFAGELLIGAYNMFMTGAGKLYSMLLITNRCDGMSKGSCKIIIEWISNMEGCIRNYFPRLFQKRQIELLHNEMLFLGKAEYVTEREGAGSTADAKYADED